MRTGILMLIAGIWITAGCRQIDKLTQFNMEYNQSVVIPPTTGISLPFDVHTPDIVTNSESTFSVNDTRKDMVEKVTLKSLDISLTSPAEADFSFLKSITVYISADSLPETRIAWKENIPDTTGKVLNLDVTNADLKEYIKKDHFNLRVNTVTDELFSTEHHMDIHSVFFVDAKILGI